MNHLALGMGHSDLIVGPLKGFFVRFMLSLINLEHIIVHEKKIKLDLAIIIVEAKCNFHTFRN